jgi:hypothetical protein
MPRPRPKYIRGLPPIPRYRINLRPLSLRPFQGASWEQTVDGLCPLGANPSPVDVITWAANKYGIAPALLIADVTRESGLNQNSTGDSGGSHGLFSVNDRPANRPGGANHYDVRPPR